MISILSIVFIVFDMILGILIPVGLLVFFKKKYHLSVKGFFIGCAVMLVFALILEQMVHKAVLGSSVGGVIRNNLWLYALYGGLMAGLFEETGRFLAMRFLMKKEHRKPQNALMYGAGHGGFEAMMLLTVGMINYLIYAVMIRAGQTQMLLEPLNDASRTALQAALDQLVTTPSWQFLLSPVERIGAVAAQIAFSIIVWYAASGRRCKWKYYFLAIFLHFALDVAAVILGKLGIPVLAIEGSVWVLAAVYVVIAVRIARKEKYGVIR